MIVATMYQTDFELVLRGVLAMLDIWQGDFMRVLVGVAYTLIVVFPHELAWLLSNVMTDGLVVGIMS